jgi:hypothetical protein
MLCRLHPAHALSGETSIGCEDDTIDDTEQQRAGEKLGELTLGTPSYQSISNPTTQGDPKKNHQQRIDSLHGEIEPSSSQVPWEPGVEESRGERRAVDHSLRVGVS